MLLTTYLHFDGTCEDAFKFYASVLGGRVLMMMRYGEAPPSPDGEAKGGCGAPLDPQRIMHARLQAGQHLLMGSDYPPGVAHKAQGFSVALTVDMIEEAERVFAALSEGGAIFMPMTETFFAHRFAMFTDRYGIPWILSCEKSDKPATKPFVIARTFDAPRDVVWECLTNADRMQNWWGPKGVKLLALKMDFRPGGRFHYGMQPTIGPIMWGLQVYREIDAPRRMTFINSFADADGAVARHPMAPEWPIEMLSTFELTETDGKTTFTVTWLPLNPTAAELACFEAGHPSMRQGWMGTLDQLESYLKTTSATRQS